MPEPALETDLTTCPACGKSVILVAYWEQRIRRGIEVLVRLETAPQFFTGRDFRGRLVMDKDKAVAQSHNWDCKAAPQPGPEPKPQVDEDERDPGWRPKK